jgi:DNA-directed RNA polymerase specialized sigma24 family protein
MQDAAVTILLELPRLASVKKKRAYLARAIKNDLINWIERRHKIERDFESLDAPRRGYDGVCCLADILEAPAPATRDEQREDRRAAALYAAISKLPLEEQLYLREIRGLNAYQPVLPPDGRKPNYNRPPGSIRSMMLRRLRKDKQLAAEVWS